MKKINWILLLAITLLFAACGNSENNSAGKETVPVVHQKGTSNVPKEIKRIVCLDYSILETLDALNIEVVGIPKGNLPAHLSKYKDNANVVDVGTLLEPNLEKINELKPDVILISGRTEKVYDELNKIAPTVFMAPDAKDFMNSMKKEWDIIGKLFGKEAAVNTAFESLQSKVAALNEKAKEKNKKALVLMFNKGKFSAYGKDSRFGVIFNVMGLIPAVEDIEKATHGQAVSNEFIQKANPDIIFVIDRSAVVDKKASNTEDVENALVKQTAAYKNGKVIYLNPDYWYLAGSGIHSANRMVEDISKALD